MASTTGMLTVLVSLVAAVPWTYAVSGSDGLFVLFALAPPLVMALLLGWRETVGTQAVEARTHPVPRR